MKLKDIPRTMSTQHPDNVKSPFFVDSTIIEGEDEIKEAFYAFSHLDIEEQLWDCEGKEADSFVVEKLLSKYGDYFSENKLGDKKFLTLRGPNPRVEKNKGKILLETLESIPRNYDIAHKFYNEDVAPIFEIAIPMTSSAEEIIRVKEYYDKYIVGKKDKKVHDVSIKKWVGDFKPDKINIIPLIEDKKSMLDAHNITGKYIDKFPEFKDKEYQRIWLARSDPALNYGSLSAVLINKISLQRLHNLQEKKSIEILPIIGCGSAPFRGNFRPDNPENCLGAYPSMQTFTTQSAFKYDFDESIVRKGIETIKNTRRKKPIFIEEEKALDIISRVSKEYQSQIKELAPIINGLSKHVPQRRKRKLHIGLFGYSRESNGVKLPRAIKFTASLYSIGLPPELLGLSALDDKDIEVVYDDYDSFGQDIKDSLRYFNEDNLSIFSDSLKRQIKKVVEITDYNTDEEHKKITSEILKKYKNKLNSINEDVNRAASIRKFLG